MEESAPEYDRKRGGSRMKQSKKKKHDLSLIAFFSSLLLLLLVVASPFLFFLFADNVSSVSVRPAFNRRAVPPLFRAARSLRPSLTLFDQNWRQRGAGRHLALATKEVLAIKKKKKNKSQKSAQRELSAR